MAEGGLVVSAEELRRLSALEKRQQKERRMMADPARRNIGEQLNRLVKAGLDGAQIAELVARLADAAEGGDVSKAGGKGMKDEIDAFFDRLGKTLAEAVGGEGAVRKFRQEQGDSPSRGPGMQPFLRWPPESSSPAKGGPHNTPAGARVLIAVARGGLRSQLERWNSTGGPAEVLRQLAKLAGDKNRVAQGELAVPFSIEAYEDGDEAPAAKGRGGARTLAAQAIEDHKTRASGETPVRKGGKGETLGERAEWMAKNAGRGQGGRNYSRVEAEQEGI